MLTTPPVLVPKSPAYRRLVSIPGAVGLAIVSYSMLVPIVFLDLCIRLYQCVYFTALNIPKVDRRRYVLMERWKLPRLSPLQRINCLYCDYVNGTIAWVKQVVNVTESYSCAIRTPGNPAGHEHQQGYKDSAEFS